MDTVKQLFGAMMLGMAAWMLARLVGDRMSLLLYCVPLVAVVFVLWGLRGAGTGRTLARAVAASAALYAVLLGVGAARGATDPLRPLASPAAAAAAELPFARVSNLDELDRAVRAAGANGRAVMLDFYADWCASCKEMERYTFANPQVHEALSHLTLLRADVTANSADDQALLRRFGIFGPPTIAFYGNDGRERSNFRVVGYMKAPEFAQLLVRATSPGG
jgi:thiol:disulfide interchange protein DsbD